MIVSETGVGSPAGPRGGTGILPVRTANRAVPHLVAATRRSRTQEPYCPAAHSYRLPPGTDLNSYQPGRGTVSSTLPRFLPSAS